MWVQSQNASVLKWPIFVGHVTCGWLSDWLGRNRGYTVRVWKHVCHVCLYCLEFYLEMIRVICYLVLQYSNLLLLFLNYYKIIMLYFIICNAYTFHFPFSFGKCFFFFKYVCFLIYILVILVHEVQLIRNIDFATSWIVLTIFKQYILF